MSAPQTNVSGSVNLTTSFTETITAGVLVNQNLPTGINQNLSYPNTTVAQTAGYPYTIDVVYGKTINTGTSSMSVFNFGASASTVANCLFDLAGTYYSWARVRELVIQNLNSFPIYVFGGNSGGSSAVPWLVSTASAIQIPACQVSTGSPTYSSLSGIYPTFRICDPVQGIGSSTGGYWVTQSSGMICVSASTSSFNFNIMAAGCTA